MRFDEGSISRAPVYRTVKGQPRVHSRFAIGITPAAGYDQVIMVTDDFAIKEYVSGTVTDRSGSITGSSDPAHSQARSWPTSSTSIERTGCRSIAQSAEPTFADLPNWPSNHRCAALRAYGDQLLALATTEAGTSFPNRVRFSDITTANNVPGSWDAADLTKSRGVHRPGRDEHADRRWGDPRQRLLIYSSDHVYQLDLCRWLVPIQKPQSLLRWRLDQSELRRRSREDALLLRPGTISIDMMGRPSSRSQTRR